MQPLTLKSQSSQISQIHLGNLRGGKLTNEAKVPCAAPLRNPSLSGSAGATVCPSTMALQAGCSCSVWQLWPPSDASRQSSESPLAVWLSLRYSGQVEPTKQRNKTIDQRKNDIRRKRFDPRNHNKYSYSTCKQLAMIDVPSQIRASCQVRKLEPRCCCMRAANMDGTKPIKGGTKPNMEGAQGPDTKSNMEGAQGQIYMERGRKPNWHRAKMHEWAEAARAYQYQ